MDSTTVIGNQRHQRLSNCGASVIPVFAPTILPSGGAIAIDADTDAWVAAVVGAGGSVSAGRKTTVNTLIAGLKTDGVWSKLDRLWLLAAENSQSALIDLKALATATAVASPTFSTDHGYTFNGSTNYLTQTFTPSTGGGNFTLNSNHLGVWCYGSPTTGGSPIGSGDGATQDRIASYSGSWIYFTNDAGGYAGAIGAGWAVATRTASNARAMYLNGSASGSDALASDASNVSQPQWIGAVNGSGFIYDPCSVQISAASIGGGLNSTNNTNLYDRLRTYMTAVGVP